MRSVKFIMDRKILHLHGMKTGDTIIQQHVCNQMLRATKDIYDVQIMPPRSRVRNWLVSYMRKRRELHLMEELIK